jgi:hypothetical protein
MSHELDIAFFEDRFEGAAPIEQAPLLAMGPGGRRYETAPTSTSCFGWSPASSSIGRAAATDLPCRRPAVTRAVPGKSQGSQIL